ncbi:MAG: hypothetical protein D6780_02100 [Candidatus Dadabacteria bacterium]|nr:MAG: hypothetical protein D6780_02100 [Candidatus Dadabacteria bacterium]
MKEETYNFLPAITLPAFFLSFLLHIGVFSLLLESPFYLKKKHSQVLDVELINMPKKKISLPKQQIVSEPQSNIEEPKKFTRLLSEKSHSTQKEMIKRGQGKVNNKSQGKKVKTKNLPSLASLSKGDVLLKAFKDTAKEKEESQSTGIMDFLPNVAQGEITLLNTKASKFAVFVRRVAKQIFFNLREESLSFEEGEKAKSPAFAVGVMDKNGLPSKVLLLRSSGSSVFDAILLNAVRDGLKDPHPPLSAAQPDGSYVFIFKAQTRVYLVRGDPNLPPQPSQWLYLAVGLK